MVRKYNMIKRTEQASQTTANIIASAEYLLTTRSLDEIDLKSIAKEAGITVQTVLRHFDSREGCLQAVAKNVAERVEKQRGKTDYKNIDESVSNLIDHYESEGKLVLNVLSQEHSEDSFAAGLLKKGRSFHRKWVKGCFGKYLADDSNDTIDALVVATDIYAWKILRLDLRRSKVSVKKITTNLIKKILEVS